MRQQEPELAQPRRPAKAAGSRKTLWMALTGVAFLAAGLSVGIVIERLRVPAAPASTELPDAQAPDDRVLTPLAEPEPVLTAESLPEAAASEALEETFEIASAVEQQEQHRDLLMLADELLFEGNYAGAHEKYSLLLNTVPEFRQAEIRLRLGLCEEALGNYRQAQAEYRKVLELHPAPELSEAAILGQARLWTRVGRPELATSTLLHALLAGACRGADATRSQIPHQLATLLSQRVQPPVPRGDEPIADYLDQNLLLPTLVVEPLQVIQELKQRTLTVPQKSLAPVEEITVVQRYSQSPEEIFVNVRANRLTALELLRRVANKTGWRVRLTEQARLQLQEHTLRPDCVDLPMALVLDAILEPYEMIWKTSEDALLVFPSRQAKADEILEFRKETAQRALRFACTFTPDHPWASASFLELSRISAHDEQFDLAVRYITQMMEQFPRSRFMPVAWFNLGKIELMQGRLDEALEAFRHAADMLGGHPLEPLAYLHVGRIQLEMDRPREAISPLTRALVLAEGSRFESMAALQLSSAYLMLEHYQRANEILMEHRAAFSGSPERDHGAFLSRLIHFQATEDDHDKFRAGSALIAAMTTLRLERSFGGHWYYLAGMAYRETGMAQEEIAAFRACLQRPYPFPVQNRVRLQLLEDAPEQLVDLPVPQGELTGSMAEFEFQSRLTEAEVVFREGNTERGIAICRNLIAVPEVSQEQRRAALRLMGKIYQSRGDHALAVRCFSGIVPDDDSDQSTATLPIPSKGVR